MKKLLLIPAALLLLLTACQPKLRYSVYQDELVLPLADESPDSLHMSIYLEYVSKGKPEVVQAINDVIIQQAFDLEDQHGSMEDCAVSYRENLIDLYLNENEGKEGVCTWQDHLEGYFEGTWKDYRVYLLKYESFRGGAHGITTRIPLVFNVKTGAQLHEEELFKEGYREPVAALLRKDLAEGFADEPLWLDMISMEEVAPNGFFYPGETGISWFFQPYEIGPYALGMVTAGAFWEDLKPYLK